MKIGFVTADWSTVTDLETGHPTLGGAGWYRCGLPHQYLKANGVDVAIAQWISRTDKGIWLADHDKVTHKDCDIIVMQRWMHHMAPEIIREARAAGQVVINDVDDWYWGLSPANLAYKYTDPKFNPKSNREHYLAALKASDAVTVSTPFLAEQLYKEGIPTVLLRNAIDLERWQQDPSKTALNGDKPDIGWVGSTSHRSEDLETLQGVLGPFVQRNDLKFVHCGWYEKTTPAGTLAGVPVPNCMVTGMRGILDYPQLFKYFDVGIVPLSTCDFNTAKSYIKLLEYSAAGIPGIAAASSENKYLHDTYGVGRIAKTRTQWIRHLEDYLDPDTREREAKQSLEGIAELDMAKRWPDWLQAYESFL